MLNFHIPTPYIYFSTFGYTKDWNPFLFSPNLQTWEKKIKAIQIYKGKIHPKLYSSFTLKKIMTLLTVPGVPYSSNSDFILLVFPLWEGILLQLSLGKKSAIFLWQSKYLKEKTRKN